MSELINTKLEQARGSHLQNLFVVDYDDDKTSAEPVIKILARGRIWRYEIKYSR
jgi:hypothetical protein